MYTMFCFGLQEVNNIENRIKYIIFFLIVIFFKSIIVFLSVVMMCFAFVYLAMASTPKAIDAITDAIEI